MPRQHPTESLGTSLLHNSYQSELPQPVDNVEDDLEMGAREGEGAAERENRIVAAPQAQNPHPFGVADDALEVRQISSELSFFDAYILTITKNTLGFLTLGMIAQSCIVPFALLAGGLKIYNDALTQADGYNKSQGLTDYALAVANAKAAYYMLQGFLATYPLLIKIITNSTTVGLVLVDMFKHAIGVPYEYRTQKIGEPSTQEERRAAQLELGSKDDFFTRTHRAAGRDHNEHTWSYWLWQNLYLQELSPIFWVFAAVAFVTADTQMVYTGNETYKNFKTNYDIAWSHLTNTTENGYKCVAQANMTLSAGQYDTCDAIASENATFLTTKQNMDDIANVIWTALGFMGLALGIIATAEVVYKLYEFCAKAQDDRTKGLPVFTTVGAITQNLWIYLIMSFAAFSYMTQSEALVDGMPKYDDWYDILFAYNNDVLGLADPKTLARSQSAALTVGYLNGEPLQNAVIVSEGILAAGLVEIAINIYLMARCSVEWRHSFTHNKLASWLTSKAFHDKYLSRLPSLAQLNFLARVLVSIVVTGIFVNTLVIDLFGRDAYLGRSSSKYSDEKNADICEGSDANMKCHVNAYANGLAYLFQSFAELLSGFMGGVLLYGPVVGALAVCALVYAISSCYRKPVEAAWEMSNVVQNMGDFVASSLVEHKPQKEVDRAKSSQSSRSSSDDLERASLDSNSSDSGVIKDYVPPQSGVYGRSVSPVHYQEVKNPVITSQLKADAEQEAILKI